MSRKTDARQITSLAVTLDPLKTYKIDGDPTRTFISMTVEDTSKGFDVALVRRGVEVQEENYVDAVGKSTATIPKKTYTIDGGVGSDIYIRDTDNVSSEVVAFLSDVPLVINEVV